MEQVESGQFPGVCWEDAAKTMFRIPWKHAGKQDFREDQDAAFFKVKGPGNWPSFQVRDRVDTEAPGVVSAQVSDNGDTRGLSQLRDCQSPVQDENAGVSKGFKMAAAEHEPNIGLSRQVLGPHVHDASPGGVSPQSVTCRLSSLLSPRPGQYLRESTRRETQKALPSGRRACAVLSTRALSLRRFLRIAIGMGLSPTRCIGCCHQEPSLVSVPLPTTLRMSLPGGCWDSLQAPWSEFSTLFLSLGSCSPGSPAQSCPSFHCLLFLPHLPSPPKALTFSLTFYSFTSNPEITIKETPQLCVPREGGE